VVTYTTKVLIPIKLVLKRVQGFLPLTGVRYAAMLIFQRMAAYCFISRRKSFCRITAATEYYLILQVVMRFKNWKPAFLHRISNERT